MSKVSIFIPVYTEEQDLAPGIKSAVKQKDAEVIVIDTCNTTKTQENIKDALAGAQAKVISGEMANISSIFNKGIANSSGDYFFSVPPNIELKENAAAAFAEAFEADPKVAMLYADYEKVSPKGKREDVVLYDYYNNLTERIDTGFIFAYRKSAVAEVGNFDEKVNTVEEYDMRLKLTDKYDVKRVGKVLYSLLEQEEEGEEVQVGKSVLHFPGQGKYGGFSYLFYTPEKEEELVRVHKDMLKRRKWYITPDPKPFPEDPIENYEYDATVITPLWNREKFIGKAIESVLRQTNKRTEHIIIDNGSTDNSREVVKEYVAKYPDRVKLIENDKNIIAYSLNLGIKASKGKYICQLDSDDEYAEHTVQFAVDHLESHPKCALGVSYYELMDEEGNILKDFGIIKHLEYDCNNILRVDGAGATRVWRKAAMFEFGLFDEGDAAQYGEDYDMVLKAGEKYDVDRLHDVLYYYRRHPDNTDSKRDPEKNKMLKTKIRERAYKRRYEMNTK